MRLRVVLGAGGDFDLLSPLQQREVVALLGRLKDDPLGHGSKALTAPCEHQRFPASLEGWRSAKTRGQAYHETLVVVYRPVGEELEVLAVGPRMGSAGYLRAMHRLAREEGTRPVEEEPRWKRLGRQR